tara:strand:+ start:568 stop:924 length:357 start_codon:yes stop_codon:yes gene_type:complete
MMHYFTLEEFDSPDAPGSGAKMDYGTLQMLDVARSIYGRPMRVNSGYRTVEHNAEVGGKISSSHLKGLAADISCTESRDRFDMITAFMRVGFTRIGMAGSFIHIDSDETKSPDVIWTY